MTPPSQTKAEDFNNNYKNITAINQRKLWVEKVLNAIILLHVALINAISNVAPHTPIMSTIYLPITTHRENFFIIHDGKKLITIPLQGFI